MEAAALSHWRAASWRERLAESLIPPGARESVMGDLRESCAHDSALLREALAAAPYVILSQMRRNLNLPALMLQSALVFCCFGGWAVVAMLPLFLLRDAWQPQARPSHRHALRDAVLVSFCGVLLFLLLPLCWPNAAHGRFIGAGCFFLGAPLSLCLCFVRTGLILDGDRRGVWLGSGVCRDELAGLARVHCRRARRRNRVEAVLLAIAALWLPRLLHEGVAGVALAAVFAVAALWLVLDTPRIAAGQDFVSLRAAYGRALMHQQQLRGFLWWLWLAPALVVLVAGLPGEGAPSLVLENSIIAVLLCFLVTALNREGGGRMREEVGLLSRLRETPV